jgi:acyl carrier protein
LAAAIDSRGAIGWKGAHLQIRAQARRHIMTTLDTLVEILVRDYCLDRARIVPEATLATVGLDSLSLLELMFKIEDRYGVKIQEDTPTNLVTVGDVVRYVDELLARKLEASDASKVKTGT